MLRLCFMSKPYEKMSVPDAATEEPKTLTPGEDAQRATRRLKQQERRNGPIYPQSRDPGRQGGEPSPAPDKR